MTSFGGDWTLEKLERVSAYLAAFQTVLKHQKFDLVYIDAFSGDGDVELRGEELPLLEQGRVFAQGSARRALGMERPFDRYHFIDASPQSVEKLRQYVAGEHATLKDKVVLRCGDVNEELPKAIAQLNSGNERAVVFADPFGMQLDWSSIETVSTKPVDFWYLAPTMAINRVLTRDGKLPESWARRLDRSLGTPDWRTGFYRRRDLDGGLFQDDRVQMEKIGGIDEIERFIHARLATVFMMAKNMLRLSDKGRPLFTLMFGCSNRNPKAFGKAIKIANHLLKG